MTNRDRDQTILIGLGIAGAAAAMFGIFRPRPVPIAPGDGFEVGEILVRVNNQNKIKVHVEELRLGAFAQPCTIIWRLTDQASQQWSFGSTPITWKNADANDEFDRFILADDFKSFTVKAKNIQNKKLRKYNLFLISVTKPPVRISMDPGVRNGPEVRLMIDHI